MIRVFSADHHRLSTRLSVAKLNLSPCLSRLSRCFRDLLLSLAPNVPVKNWPNQQPQMQGRGIE